MLGIEAKLPGYLQLIFYRWYFASNSSELQCIGLAWKIVYCHSKFFNFTYKFLFLNSIWMNIIPSRFMTYLLLNSWLFCPTITMMTHSPKFSVKFWSKEITQDRLGGKFTFIKFKCIIWYYSFAKTNNWISKQEIMALNKWLG